MTDRRVRFTPKRTRVEIPRLEGTKVTCRSFREYLDLDVFRFSGGVNGKKVLDVGSGGSDSVPVLLSMGADAYGLDVSYKSIPDTVGKSRRFLNMLRGLPEEILQGRKEAYVCALESFRKCQKENPERFIARSILETDLPDEIFDVVLSANCVTEVLDADFGTFSRAVGECVRLVKPGGEVHLYPFGASLAMRLNGYSGATAVHERLLRGLLDRPDLGVDARDTVEPGLYVVRITKLAA